MAPKYELCVGLNKGQKTTKIIQKQYKGDRKEKGIRQARKKNVSRKIHFESSNHKKSELFQMMKT
jgi:large subunit ribosomal protein L36e